MSSSYGTVSTRLDPLAEATRAAADGRQQVLPSGPPERDPSAIVDCPELLSLLRQDWTVADKATLLSTFHVVRCYPRAKAEYLPPTDVLGCEDASAAEEWRKYFDERTLKDPRVVRDRKKVVVIKDDEWTYTIRENSILIDASTNTVFGFVMHNFVPSDPPASLASGLLSYLNTTALKLGDMVRNARRDDLGKMPQLGYTAGSRSAVPRTMTWCRGLSTATHTTGFLRSRIHEATSIVALVWSASKAVLPQAIIDDFEKSTREAGLPQMDWNSYGKPVEDKHVSVKVGSQTYEFTGLELGPCHAFAAQNYTRFTHNESNDNEYLISLTTNRTAPESEGRHFYYAKYGVKVVSRTGSLMVHRVADAHGTTLPHRSPKEEMDKAASMEQNGLSLLLPMGIIRAWKNYQAQQQKDTRI